MTTPIPGDHVELRSGAYADSVTLLQVSRRVQHAPGVVTAQVAMATPLNLDVLTAMGFEIPDGANPNDLVVAVRLGEDGDLPAALAAVDLALAESRTAPAGPSESAPPRTTAAALRLHPGALALVSVPGASAAAEAMDALEAGSDVMIFSDNVPVAQELALKQYAASHDLLVMGPDCGTAIVGGLGLGFANVVEPGPVGIVAASGTGCQQILALLDHACVGVGSAYGVGGRDLSTEIGGLATRIAVARMEDDPAVELILVISKSLPNTPLSIWRGDGPSKPTISAMLGPGNSDLTTHAEAVLRALGREVPEWPVAGTARAASGGDTLQGLFVGGTLKNETALLVGEAGAKAELVDFGDDAYTTGRAHPMIDPTLRLDRLTEVGADDTTAVILLDVVLGHGAEDDPAASLAPVIAAIAKPVVVAVVGTRADPQGLDRQVAALVAAGAEVHLSNAGATRSALTLLGGHR